MAGLLDFLNTPAGIGLLSSVAGYAAGARRGQPWNSVGRGLVTGLQGYQNANDQIRLDADKDFSNKYRQMQMDEMRGKISDNTAMRDAASQAFQASRTPAQAAIPAMFGVGEQRFADQQQAQAAAAPYETSAPVLGDNPLMAGMTGAMQGDFSQQPMSPQQAFNMPGRKVETYPEQAARPGGFDPVAYRQNMFAQLAGAGNPTEAMKWAPPEAKVSEPYSLSPGQVRFGADGKQVASVPAAEKEGASLYGSEVSQWLNIRGIDPKTATLEQRLAAEAAGNAEKLTRAKAGGVNIGPTRIENISTQESEGSKVYGKGLGEMQIDMQKQGFSAPSRIANLDRMSELLEGVDSGRFSGAGLEAARFAKSFGLNVDPKLGNKQAAEALAIEMALKMRDPGSGPMTDKDFNNYMNTVPSLAKTADGRREITATLRAKAKRDVEISKMARAYAKQNRGVIDDNFLDIVSDHMAKNPVIPVDKTPSGGWGIKRVK